MSEQSVTIQSFGPIKNVVLPINDIIIFNGKQSSGKSTIAKVVYLFKSLPDIISQLIVSDRNLLQDFDKKLVITVRSQILAMFGTTKHFNDFEIILTYGKQKNIRIVKDYNSGHARVTYSKELKDALKEVANSSNKFWKSSANGSINNFKAFYISRSQFFNEIHEKISKIFDEQREAIYIPAGRSLVSTLSGELRNIDSYNFDSLMKDFVQKILHYRDQFSKNLDEIIEDKKKLTANPIDFEKVSKAKKLITDIIQSEYRYENGEEKLILDKETYVKIKFSSSGQQEALWILNLLFLQIVDNKKSFMVLEEPESHLYPEAQYAIVKFIALFFSNTENQGIITTHSPYVMAALNTLLLAGQAKDKHTEKIKKIIDKQFWIDISRVSAYFVENGEIKSILDKETNLIDPYYIDSASMAINEDFDALLALEGTNV
jgi:predicted ATPase